MRAPSHPDSWSRAEGDRRVSPSAERNIDPIGAVLARVLPARGRVLEVASGSGQHGAAFARRWPGLVWQPTDANPGNLASIAAWGAGLDNLRPPMVLDACAPGWGAAQGGQDAICLNNLLHLIAAPEVEVLLREVALALAPGGVFCLYGPFRRDGRLVTEGDVAFDARLKAMDPAIGYKEVGWVEAQLAAAGLEPVEQVEMPAGNLMLIARRPAVG